MMIMSPLNRQPSLVAYCHSHNVPLHYSSLLMPLLGRSLCLAVGLVQCQYRHCKGFQRALELFEPEK